MRSFLKRISPASQLDRRLKEVAHIRFDLDEPDFLINKKLGIVSTNVQYSHRPLNSSTHSCEICGNGEFSLNAKFCKICGSEFSNK